MLTEPLRHEASELHLLQQLQHLLRLLTPLSRTDGRAVCDHIWEEASELHLLQQMQHLLWVVALPARADGDCVWQETSELNPLQESTV